MSAGMKSLCVPLRLRDFASDYDHLVCQCRVVARDSQVDSVEAAAGGDVESFLLDTSIAMCG